MSVRILLIAANTETLHMPTLPFGLACVAAATRSAGHDAHLLNLMFARDSQAAVAAAVRESRPDVVGISVRNIDDQNMAAPRFLLPPVRDVVAACRRESEAPIVVGGAGYSIFPETALRYLGADIGIQGEGEVLFVEVIRRIGAGGDCCDLPGAVLPGRAAPGFRLGSNLDNLPLPDPVLWLPQPADPSLWIPVQSRRGCPMDCSYCSTSAIEGRPVRRRSPAEVVRWMTRARAAGYRNFTFVDNTFNVPLPYAKELCRGIIQAGLDLNIWCIVYPKWVDRELAELMRAAGCTEVSLGFESGSEAVLRGLNKRYSRAEITSASGLFAAAGIPRRGFLLLGAPGETRETVEESLEFADLLNLDALKVTAGVRVYPGTAVARAAAGEDLIAADDDLLMPRFYVAPAVRDWLTRRIAEYKARRPWVM